MLLRGDQGHEMWRVGVNGEHPRRQRRDRDTVVGQFAVVIDHWITGVADNAKVARVDLSGQGDIAEDREGGRHNRKHAEPPGPPKLG